jgi:hypothetical protein
MDPGTIALAAVTVLAPYFAKAGEAVAGKVGEAAWEKMKAVYTAVKGKLTGDPYAEETLKRVEEEPQSGSRQAALASVLEDKIKTDASFGQNLLRLVEEAKKSGAQEVVTQTLTVSGTVVGDTTQIGKVGGDVNIGPKHD